MAGGRRRGRHGHPHPPHPPHPPGTPPGFGPGGFGPPWGGGRRDNWFGQMFGGGRRARRGNVRGAILTLLAEAPVNGYQLMQQIEQKSHGAWKPSSGSIYPTLQQLEDEGLVETEEAKPGQTGSRTYRLTAKGKRYVDEHEDELDADWDSFRDDPSGNPRWEIANLFRSVASAAMQVAQTGTPAQLDEAKKLLNDVRRKLYGLLAEADPDE